MAVYLKEFSTHQEYETFTATTAFIKPNVSICTTEGDVHYNPLACEESSTYELVGTPSYPSEVDGASTSFDMTFNYKKTDINEKCSETVTEDSDTVTVEIGANPSTASSRTVEGTYDYHGLEIPYSVTQTKFEAKITAKFNVTDTSSATQIIGYRGSSSFTAIEIDGVEQQSVVSAHTFTTTGMHTVKYTLRYSTTIGDNAFAGCSNLTSIDIPDSVTSIGTYAFYSCSSLTRMNSDIDGVFNIPSGVTSIGSSAFYACYSLTSIDIPSGVTSIGFSVFNACRGLTSIGLIGSGASVEIPDSVTSIDSNAFYECSGLKSIDIPDSVTSIGTTAFRKCTSLTSCTIGSGVTSIGGNAFYNCTSLTSITVESITPPTLANVYVFNGTNNCPIYVPSESVETYKSATNWSDYASRIQAIP